jgi:hypothetical protein
MKDIIFKKRWKKNSVNTFTELGLDKENNKYIIGISTEFEKSNGIEIRKNGFTEMKIKEIYIRVWLLKFSFSIGTGEIELVKKNRKNLKLIFGLAGLI